MLLSKSQCILTTVTKALKALGFGERRCAHCLTPYFPAYGSEDDSFCPQCRDALRPYNGLRCALCGLPGGNAGAQDANPSSSPANICVDCQRKKPPWQFLAYHGLYSGPLRDLLLRLKFDGELRLARPLAQFMVECAIKLPRPDVIVAVPQYPATLRKRGYNQVYELARQIATQTGFPVGKTLLRRDRPGKPQESLNATQRRLNLKDAFSASTKVKGKCVWLVDDIMTTGSTITECSKTLLAAGASHVCAMFVARTSL